MVDEIRPTSPHPSPLTSILSLAAAALATAVVRAHRASNGMYSVNIGRWHVVSINSGRGVISGAQLQWVGRNLGGDGHRCELAFWHHPRWSSGTRHGWIPPLGRSGRSFGGTGRCRTERSRAQLRTLQAIEPRWEVGRLVPGSGNSWSGPVDVATTPWDPRSEAHRGGSTTVSGCSGWCFMRGATSGRFAAAEACRIEVDTSATGDPAG
jgi:hypothetical protein